MKIAIFHAAAGYGHQKVAEVIQQAFWARGLKREEVTLEDALDSTPSFFRKSYPQTYFSMVKHCPGLWGWCYETTDIPQIYRLIYPFRTRSNRGYGQKLLDRVIQENPDHIICTHFFSAELFARAKREGKLRSKLTTVITDFYPHTFWVNDLTDFYWVMDAETQENLEKRGVSREKIVAGGIPVAPEFKPAGRRRDILKKFGLDGNRFTLLITSGSFGFGAYAEALRILEIFSDKLQCFVVCGNNQAMKAMLEKETYQFPIKIFGFVNFMSELMEASDLMLAKPGGATTVESLSKGVPMIITRPIPGQETRNAKFLKAKNASFFIETPDQIKPVIQSVFENPDVLAAKKEAIRKIAKPGAADDLVSFIFKNTAV